MRRPTWLFWMVGLAPVVVLAAMTLVAVLQDQTTQEQFRSASVAREVNAVLDGEIIATRAVLAVLATSVEVQNAGSAAPIRRARGIMTDHPEWADVYLTDSTSGQEEWSATTGSRSAPMRGEVQAFLARGDFPAGVGDVGGEAVGCPCIPVHYPFKLANGRQLVLSALLTTDAVQAQLVRRSASLGQAVTAALVDRRGIFAARTIAHRERLGKPATKYVRSAIASGASGTYDGVTYEGLDNRTTFEKSALTGYSTHIALSARPYDLRGTGALALTVLASLLAIAGAILGVVYFWRQQSEWREDQLRQIQSQKMAALGQFASGVAHDFNNLLSVMMGSFDALARTIETPREVKRIELGRMAVDKGTALVSQLLDFARQKPVDPEEVPLGPLLEGLRGLIERTVSKPIRVEIELSDPALAVCVNQAALEMALLNLAANARDAMEQGGNLKFSARPASQRGWTELLVADNGSGMPAEVAKRAGDPFFTTKARGKGTGLGLAQVQSLMVQAGGTLQIESVQGQGTTITLRFPPVP